MAEREAVFRIEPGTDRSFELSGELDMASSDEVANAVGSTADSPGDIVFDLTALSFIDSSGVLALAKVSERLGEGRLVLRHPTDPVRRVLDLVGLTDAAPAIVIED